MGDEKKPDWVYQVEVIKLQAEAKEAEAKAAREQEDARRLHAVADAAEIDLDIKRRQFEIAKADNDFHRIYRFTSDVNEGSVRACMETIDIWRRIYSGQPITIIFTSPGGSVVPGMALWDYLTELRQSGIHLTTVAQGYAASMAGILLQAGDKRILGRESYLLIHEVQASAIGTFGELTDRMKWLEKLQERILDIFATRASQATNQAFHQTRRMIEKNWKRTDWWIDSDLALKLGFVDEVQ